MCTDEQFASDKNKLIGSLMLMQPAQCRRIIINAGLFAETLNVRQWVKQLSWLITR